MEIPRDPSLDIYLSGGGLGLALLGREVRVERIAEALAHLGRVQRLAHLLGQAGPRPRQQRVEVVVAVSRVQPYQVLHVRRVVLRNRARQGFRLE